MYEYAQDCCLNFGKSSSGQKSVGAAVRRRAGTQWMIELFEFHENDQYNNLDSLMIQIGACTVYLPEEDMSKSDARKIQIVLDKEGVETIRVKKSLYKSADVSEQLLKLVGQTTHSTTTANTSCPLAFPAISVLLNKLKLMDDHVDHGSYLFQLGSLRNFLRLDSAAIEAINLLPKPDMPSVYGSIYGVLNRCKTKMGSRLLERWLRQPLVNHTEINKRLDIVEVLRENTHARTTLVEQALKGVPDLESIINKLQRRDKAGLAEVYKLYTFCKATPNFTGTLVDLVDSSEADGKSELAYAIKEKFLDPLNALNAKFEKYEKLVEHVIDMKKLPEYMINSAHSPELQELRDEADALDDEAHDLHQHGRRTWASFTDMKMERNPQHGYIFRTTKPDDERQLRSNCKEVIILSLLKNGVHFTTPKLQDIADRVAAIEKEYKVKQVEIVKQAVDTASTYLPVAEAASVLVAELDILASFATVAALSPAEYCRPKVTESGGGVLKLKAARHPCVEMMDMVTYIPNDYELVRGESNFQIITGPNMGGKSTYIRAIGCIVTMAQIGCFVPCEGAEISAVDCILARVGAGDAVQKGISTFMAEMLEASVILETATSDSLIIIDELGRGTSTADGFGLAWAISDYIIGKLSCPCLFATHFFELTSLEDKKKCVKNKHVSVHTTDNEITMLYGVMDGPCTTSFGCNVAKMAGFPTGVIDEAKRKITVLENNGKLDEEGLKHKKVAEERMGQFANLDCEGLDSKAFCRATYDLCSKSQGVEHIVNDVKQTPQGDSKVVMNSLFNSKDFDDDEMDLLEDRMGVQAMATTSVA